MTPDIEASVLWESDLLTDGKLRRDRRSHSDSQAFTLKPRNVCTFRLDGSHVLTPLPGRDDQRSAGSRRARRPLQAV